MVLFSSMDLSGSAWVFGIKGPGLFDITHYENTGVRPAAFCGYDADVTYATGRTRTVNGVDCVITFLQRKSARCFSLCSMSAPNAGAGFAFADFLADVGEDFGQGGAAALDFVFNPFQDIPEIGCRHAVGTQRQGISAGAIGQRQVPGGFRGLDFTQLEVVRDGGTDGFGVSEVFPISGKVALTFGASLGKEALDVFVDQPHDGGFIEDG